MWKQIKSESAITIYRRKRIRNRSTNKIKGIEI